MSIKCVGSAESVELHGGRWSIQQPLARGKQNHTLFEGRHSSFNVVPLLCAAKLVMFFVRSTLEVEVVPIACLKYYLFRSHYVCIVDTLVDAKTYLSTISQRCFNFVNLYNLFEI